ncbi:YceH family protein [Candidatus Sumerlaeota bacterium]|nr:YceH family protein [Candidatus Sumerlaeota bacterium]
METLTHEEIRVLGCLIEKQLTTPAYYPMSLNAVMQACNQKTNRHPVVEYDEETVGDALQGLREKQLAIKQFSSDARVPKHRHEFPARFDLNSRETALLCVLLLRGAQTPGELRQRTGRMTEFESLDQVEETLAGLIQREPAPLAVRLPRLPGSREYRYMHLLGGTPDEALMSVEHDDVTSASGGSTSSRLRQLEDETQQLRSELENLKQEFEQWKKQFE